MISKLRFSLVAVIMLVLLGFGFQNQAQGQIGTDGLFCPAVETTTGWIETNISPSIVFPPDVSIALIGTVESLLGGSLHGGADWMHVDNVDTDDFESSHPTNVVGSQLISWWTQTGGPDQEVRNTYLCTTQ